MSSFPARLTFACLLLFSILFFLRRAYILFSLVLLGQPESRFDRLRARMKGLLLFGFGQRRVLEEPFGLNHFFLFWGFILLQGLVNFEFLLQAIFPRFSLDFVGEGLHAVISLAADMASYVVLLVVVIAILRRLFFRPAHVERNFDAFLILSLVALLMIAYFGINGTAMLSGAMAGPYHPFSRLFARIFLKGLDKTTISVLSAIFWWIHGLVLLAFLTYIPYSKHLHILTALINCFFRRLSFPAAMSRMIFKKGEIFGISKVVQFTWKDLLDFFSCTECGRCARACPATATGKVLNPKEVILEGKANLLASGTPILASRGYDSLGRADMNSVVAPLMGTDEKVHIRPEAVWDCTTCGACVERCPVFIEQFPKLLALRRHLVMEKVEFPPELINLFENIEQRHNPFGMAPADRGKWAEELAVPLLSKVKEAEYLLFAGCVPSFNGRMRNVLASLVQVMGRAGLSFATLGREEKCCGDPLRRLGNEYVFDGIAARNVELFKSYNVRKVITLCPHCYNTLKNEYHQYGATFDVMHHTELLSTLVKDTGVVSGTALHGQRIVFHDSCYLGRYNGVYEEPRSVIATVTGQPPEEMERSRNESFCCGAGGGRMWMHEATGTRINLERTRQALAEKPDIIATCCPYCLTMFEDGLKDEDAPNVHVLDVAEIAAKGLKRSDE